MNPYVHCSIIHGGQDTETTQPSFNGCVDKEVVVIYTLEHYSAIRKYETLPFLKNELILRTPCWAK